MKDLGEISSYLGIAIRRNRADRIIFLNQFKYIEDILKKYGMENTASIKTPMDVNMKLTKDMCPKTQEEFEEIEEIPYQSAIESLMYLILGTQPDIAYAVGVLNQFNSCYRKQHWQAVKRVFRYL